MNTKSKTKLTLKQIISNSLIFFLFFILSLAVAEIYIRVTKISLPSIVMNHPKMGRVFKPNAEVMILNEGMYMGRINPYGYTGPAYPPEREDKALRIALIGDSYVQGHYMADRFYFGNVMGRKLQAVLKRRAAMARWKQTNGVSVKTDNTDVNTSNTGADEFITNVEVLNFGIAGIDLQRMYIRYLEQAAEFKPDITLFVLGPGDLLKLDRNLAGKCYLENNQLKTNYDFSRSKTYQMKVKYDFIRQFSFYPLIQKAYALYRNGETADILLGKLNPFKSKEDKSDSRKEPPTQETDRHFAVNEAIFKALAELDRNRGAPGQTRRSNQNNPNKGTRVIIVLKKQLPDYYNRLLSRLNLEVIDLTPPIEKMKADGIDPNYWKATSKMGHWNHEAQGIIGTYLAQYLAKLPIYHYQRDIVSKGVQHENH